MIIYLLRFRLLGRLETKYEDTMTEYYLAFTSMCKRVAGLPLTEEEGRHIKSFVKLLGTRIWSLKKVASFLKILIFVSICQFDWPKMFLFSSISKSLQSSLQCRGKEKKIQLKKYIFLFKVEFLYKILLEFSVVKFLFESLPLCLMDVQCCTLKTNSKMTIFSLLGFKT